MEPFSSSFPGYCGGTIIYGLGWADTCSRFLSRREGVSDLALKEKLDNRRHKNVFIILTRGQKKIFGKLLKENGFEIIVEGMKGEHRTVCDLWFRPKGWKPENE